MKSRPAGRACFAKSAGGLPARTLVLIAATAALGLGADKVCAQTPAKPASARTAAHNSAGAAGLPFNDHDDFDAVQRGLVAPSHGIITDATGRAIWNIGVYDFLKASENPDTVNPSLWRMAQLNSRAGLYMVAEGVYQLRGFDLASMTVIEGRHGLIVVDPLTTTETARAALAFYNAHRSNRPVVAIIYTHSHVDHFGGARGVVEEADVKSGNVQIYAPAGFLREAASENVLAGTAMLRRAQYQSGGPVERGERGQVDTGLGKGTPAGGVVSLIAPTVTIADPYETRIIDGVQFEFQLTPGTEAPAEMNFYLPQARALCIAENATRTMHNILTPRGALVRDARAWSRFLDDSLVRYADRTDVMFAQHNWPTWGSDRIRTMLADQRDMYAFLNDRTLHLINKGLTPAEIAEAMKTLPGSLGSKWYTRGYYGTLSFNARAVYQRYLGFYDANPSNLDPLPPIEEGKRYVEALGGRARVLELMRSAMAEGDYRWAVKLGNHLLFAAPDDRDAREAQADALEQLGYQAESSLWRNMYLTGAMELRNGVQVKDTRRAPDLIRALDPTMFFDFLAVRLDSGKAQGHDMTLNWIFTDLGRSFAITVRNGVMTWREGTLHAAPDTTIRMDKDTLDRVNLRELELAIAVKEGHVTIEGHGEKLRELMTMLATFDPAFNIVTP